MGRHLAEHARAAGHECAALVRSEPAGRLLAAIGCRVVRGDLGDAAALEALARGADAVVHVAGLIAARSEAEFLRVNRDGTARVAAAARAAGAGRVVYVSSLAVTGPATPGRPRDESGPPAPVTAYGRSKAAGEEALRAAGVPFSIVRPAIVYGPRDREVLRLFRAARLGLVPLPGRAAQELSLVEAGDLADAVLAVCHSAAAQGGVYHVAHPQVITQVQLVHAIGRAVGRDPALVRLPRPVVRALLALAGAAARLSGRPSLVGPDKAPELFAPAWTCAVEAVARDAGWHARTAHEEGLARTAEWYRRAGWL